MSVVSDILTGIGGKDGLADGVAHIIGSVKGTNVPQSVTYVQPPATSGAISPVILIGGGLVLVVVMIMILNK